MSFIEKALLLLLFLLHCCSLPMSCHNDDVVIIMYCTILFSAGYISQVVRRLDCRTELSLSGEA